MTALVDATDARIDVDGAAVVEGLTCRVEGDGAALLGGFSPLFRLLSGDAILAGGSLLVAGMRADVAVQNGAVGLALLDVPLPNELTVLELCATCARLSGAGRREAVGLATRALERTGTLPLAKAKVGRLGLAERRAALIAQACIGEPPVVALERPLEGLDGPYSEYVLAVALRAAEGRALLVSTALPPATGDERRLVDRAGHVLVLERGLLVGDGRVSQVLVPGSRYAMTVTKNGEALVEKLRERGLEPISLALLGAARLVVHLPDGASTSVLLDAALEAEAPPIELVPLPDLGG